MIEEIWTFIVNHDVMQMAAVIPFLFVLLRRTRKIEERVSILEKKIDIAIIQSGTAVAWSDRGAPLVETIEAILLNISLGADGNHEERLIEVVLSKPDNMNIYKSILNRHIKEYGITDALRLAIDKMEAKLR